MGRNHQNDLKMDCLGYHILLMEEILHHLGWLKPLVVQDFVHQQYDADDDDDDDDDEDDEDEEEEEDSPTKEKFNEQRFVESCPKTMKMT